MTSCDTETIFTSESIELLNKSKVKFQNTAEPIQRINDFKGALDKSEFQIHFKDIVWKNVLIFTYLHFYALYGFYLFWFDIKWPTFWWTVFYTILSIEGTGAGAHRLWAHRTYKAKLPLRIFLMICQTISGQNHIYEWSRDHRVHHKFVDTNADPHNSQRGFFFSHVGWLMVRKHKDVIVKGKTVDLSDLREDRVVMFQKKYYGYLLIFFTYFLPAWVPWYFWGENGWKSYYVCTIFRYVICLNGTWFVNSAAHMWGYKPYDKSIQPVECKAVSILTWGEGWHNYHHVFPWDYKAAELGDYKYNLTTAFIDFMAKIGQAYDLKTVSPEMVKKRIQRTGDETRKFDIDDYNKNSNRNKRQNAEMEKMEEVKLECTIWGWGDKEMKPDLISEVISHNKLTEL